MNDLIKPPKKRSVLSVSALLNRDPGAESLYDATRDHPDKVSGALPLAYISTNCS